MRKLSDIFSGRAPGMRDFVTRVGEFAKSSGLLLAKGLWTRGGNDPAEFDRYHPPVVSPTQVPMAHFGMILPPAPVIRSSPRDPDPE